MSDSFDAIAKEALALLDTWDTAMWIGGGERVRDPDLVSLEKRYKELAEQPK